MCFCNIEKPDRDVEFMLPNRPRRQASQRLSSSSQLRTGHNLSTLPRRREPLGAFQTNSRPRTAEFRISVSQERLVLVEIITPRVSGVNFCQQPGSSEKRPLSKDSQREIRPLSIAESNGELGPRLIPAKSPRQSNGTVAVITTQQSGSEVRMLIRSEKQSNANDRSPRQSATSVRSISHASKRERLVEVDEENSKSWREYERRDKISKVVRSP